MVRFWLLLLACIPGIAGALATEAAAAPEAMVIVIKDAGFSDKLAALVKAETPADAKPLPEAPPEPPIYEQLDDIWLQFTGWLSTQRLQLLILGAGLILTYAVALVLNWLLWNSLLRLARKTKSKHGSLLCERMRAPSLLLLCIIGIFLSSFPLFQTMSQHSLTLWKHCFAATVALCVVWGISRLVDVFDKFLRSLVRHENAHLNGLLTDLLRKVLKVILFLVAVLFIGQNILGLNLTALLAGAGVAGLAIAFAAQATLANFFGSISIILDQTFNIGDRVKVDTVDGIVEGMGLHSTKLRSLDGNVFTIPNRLFADNVIENISSRPNIKYPFEIGLVYETTAEQMKRAKEILLEVLNRPDMFDMDKLPPRIWFSGFGAYSLNLSVTVWFNTRDALLSQDWKEELNLEILRRFNAAGLGFAFPSQTIYMAPTEINSNQ